jgi:inner membrane protein
MDNVTHSLIAVLLVRGLGMNRWTPGALPVALLAANLPDADALAVIAGAGSYFDWHRGITHSLTASPVMALAAVGLVRLIPRLGVKWRGGWLAGWIAVLSHIAIDLMTGYGVRLWLPFDARWTQLSILALFDAILFTALLVAAVGPLLSRLVSGEIGAKATTGQGLAWFGLLFTLGWAGFRYVEHDRARQTLEARLYEGRVPRRVEALADVANPFRWRGLVEGEGFVVEHDVDLLGEFDPEAGEVTFQPENVPEAARRASEIQTFLKFAQWPVWRVVPVDEPEGGRRVSVTDLRFGERFEAWVTLDVAGRKAAGGTVLR